MATTSRRIVPTAGGRRALTGWQNSSNSSESAWTCMHPLDSRGCDQNHLADLHAGLSIARHYIGLNNDRLAGAERIAWHRTRRTAFAAENWRQITPSVPVQKIVDDREACIFDDARCFDDLRRCRARLEHRSNRIEGRVGRLMQVAIEFVWLAERKAAQHLTRMFPECRGDFCHHDVPRLDAPHARKLAWYTQIR